MPFLDLDQTRLFYTDEGDGDPPVLMIHGWTCDSFDWSWQVPTFTANHRVIAADNRGHGRSTRADGAPLTPRAMAADLAALLDALGTGPVIAMGHSMGGIIATALAVEHPQHVRAVVGVDPAYGVGGDMAELVRGSADVIRAPGGEEIAAALLAALEGPATPPGLAAWHRRRVLANPHSTVADAFSGMFDGPDQVGLLPESADYLARRRCPVLAIYANPAQAEWEQSILTDPASRAIAWEGSGHWLHQERPDEFNAVVEGWIAGLD